MEDSEWQRAAGLMGIEMRGIPLEPVILRQFLKDHPNGLYLVATCDHLFVVDNGIIIDPRTAKLPGLRRTIRQAWRVR